MSLPFPIEEKSTNSISDNDTSSDRSDDTTEIDHNSYYYHPESGAEDGVFPPWSRFTQFLHNTICRTVVGLSVYSARYPKVILTIVPILSFGLLFMGYFSNFTMILDMDVAFSPFNSLPTIHRQQIKDLGFPGTRRTFLISIEDKEGKDVLNVDGMSAVFEAIDRVKQLPIYNTICNERNYTDPNNSCQILSPARFWKHDMNKFLTSVKSRQDLVDTLSKDRYPDGYPNDLTKIIDIGSANSKFLEGNDGKIQSTYAYFIYMAMIDGDGIAQFENEALEAIFELQEEWEATSPLTYPGGRRHNLKLLTMAAQSLPNELNRAILNDLPLIPVVGFIMSSFTCLVFFRKDYIQSRMLLGVGSVITVGFSMMSGYGLMAILGVPYTNMTTVLPFIIVGIGLDDTFIITGYYFHTDSKSDTVKRIADTMSTVGMSIFVTTLTTSLAFIFGLIATIPAIYWLCLYAFPTIMIDFIYQITFFIAILVLDERRIQENRMDVFFWVHVDTESKSTGNSVQYPSNSEIGNEKKERFDDEEQTEESNMLQDQQQPQEERGANKVETIPTEDVNSSNGNTNNSSNSSSKKRKKKKKNASLSYPDRLMIWYSNKLMTPMAKLIVIIFFTILFGSCAYSATLMEQVFNPLDLVPSDSYLLPFYHTWDEYNGQGMPVKVYFHNVNQSDPIVQDQMIKYIEELVELPYFGEQSLFCWVKDYKEIMNSPIMQETNRINLFTGKTFNEQIDTLLSIPPLFELYGRHIVRDEKTGDIIASRCELIVNNLDKEDVQELIGFLLSQRKVTQQQPLNVIAEKEGGKKTVWPFFSYFSAYLMFEFFAVHISELASTTVAGLVAVTFVSLIFLPHWTAPFFILPLMATLYIDLIGMLQFCGLHMNVVTFVALVISIGLLVDFVIHVLLRYYESTEPTREGKVKDSLRTLGSSIFVGGLSTFLGVIPLALSTSEVIKTIYICFLVMIVLGVSYGLILLPVLLSVFGPATSMPNHDSNRSRSSSSSKRRRQQRNVQQQQEEEQRREGRQHEQDYGSQTPNAFTSEQKQQQQQHNQQQEHQPHQQEVHPQRQGDQLWQHEEQQQEQHQQEWEAQQQRERRRQQYQLQKQRQQQQEYPAAHVQQLVEDDHDNFTVQSNASSLTATI